MYSGCHWGQLKNLIKNADKYSKNILFHKNISLFISIVRNCTYNV